MVKITRLSKRAVVRMWHACPASWSHSMIVRRLCVTPAVGSLMQWLLTRRNRTTERTNREATRQQRESCFPLKEGLYMSHEIRQTELQEQTQKLLRGSLKYARVAALA